MKTKFRFSFSFTITIIAICSLIVSCSQLSESEEKTVKDNVLSIMDIQLKTVNDLDVDGVVALFKSSPEFLACIDGYILNYEEFVNAEREGFKALKSVPTVWDTVYVRVLSPTLAIALAPFHQTQIDINGIETKWTGDVTCVAQYSNGKWQNIYAHAAHRPDTIKQ